MLSLLKAQDDVCNRISRRGWLQVGGLGTLGMSLPGLLRAEDSRDVASRERLPGPAKSCVVVWLAGGPSQVDMWDMKPKQPVEIRGEFKAIATIYTLLGISPDIELPDHMGRPVRVGGPGNAIQGVMA